jgi:chromosome segregation ATPase
MIDRRGRNSIYVWLSLRALGLDLTVAFVLLVVGGTYWAAHQGVDRIAAARNSCEKECAAGREELRAAREALAISRTETEALRAERDARLVEADALVQRIQEERQSLTALWEEGRPMVERAADLQGSIERLRQSVCQSEVRLADLDRRVASRRDEVSALALQLEERRRNLEQAAKHPSPADGGPSAAIHADRPSTAMASNSR